MRRMYNCSTWNTILRVMESERTKAGLALIAKWEANIVFIKERIAIQNQEGYSRHKFVGLLETWERQYCQLDIDREQDKIDKANLILER